jgi:hypothetical protein
VGRLVEWGCASAEWSVHVPTSPLGVRMCVRALGRFRASVLLAVACADSNRRRVFFFLVFFFPARAWCEGSVGWVSRTRSEAAVGERRGGGGGVSVLVLGGPPLPDICLSVARE